jgi:thiamine biosynthesis lipoprotein
MKTRDVSFEAIGTRWAIAAQHDMSTGDWQELERRLQTRIDEFDAVYSRFRGDSLVTRMSKQAGSYDLPVDAYKLLQFYDQLYKATEGRVTPLIGQVVSDAGYDAQYSLQPKPLRQPPAWDEVISYDKHTITLTQPALLDFGAAGKGYLVDIVGGLLEAAGVEDYLINAGGDILHKSVSGSRVNIGLENPLDHSEVIGTASLSNQSICASSGSRRAWGQYNHIIDPQSLTSPTQTIATWAVADSAMVADGLATALYFTDPSQLRQQFDFSYAVLYDDMSLEYARNFPTIIYEASK